MLSIGNEPDRQQHSTLTCSGEHTKTFHLCDLVHMTNLGHRLDEITAASTNVTQKFVAVSLVSLENQQ